MTTKLEHSINPLNRAQHCKFAVNTLIVHRQHPRGSRLLRRKSPSMERVIEFQNIESMKKMMLMQEQVFKQQVSELHRLYNLQKKLMQDIENGLNLRKETSQVVDENEVLTGSNFSRMPIKFYSEIPNETESTPSSSIHPFEGLKKMDEEADVEVELTLSIGHCTRKNMDAELEKPDWSNQAQHLGSHSTQTDKRDAYGYPHWLLRDLS